MNKIWINAIRSYSAIPLAIAGFLLSALIISRGYWAIVGPALGLTAGATLASGWILFIKGQNTSIPSRLDSDLLPYQIPIILSSCYIISVLVSLRYYTHHRPLVLYVIFGGYAGTIAYQIARGEPKRRIVPQIMIFAFFAYWSSQLIFPAGMYNPDTFGGYIPTITNSLQAGFIPVSRYFGHLVYATEFTLLTNLSAQTGYYLVSTLLLTCVIPLISILDRVLPAISSQTLLYAALIFSSSSWMLRRGMHPNKLNFFYGIILLLGIVAIQLYRAKSIEYPRRWALLGFVTMPAIIFGHRYSAGAAMVFLISIGAFRIISKIFGYSNYLTHSIGSAVLFIIIYVLGVGGNPLHKDSLLSRLSGIVMSFFAKSGAGGGGGRYSEIALEVLAVSTFAQTLLFALATLGGAWMIRQSDWEYDLVIFWMGALGAFILFALLQNSADTQPQRFYALLVLFGLNICTGVVLSMISRYHQVRNRLGSIPPGRIAVVILVITFSVASLASPVADETTSPVADEVPHSLKFHTHQQIAGEEWIKEYNSDILVTLGSGSNVPIQTSGGSAGQLNLSTVDSGSMYAYSELANRTGRVTSGGLGLGGRNRLFVRPPSNLCDSMIYTNGEKSVFRRETIC